MESNEINLGYLEATFGDNKMIINKVLQSFMDNTPSLLSELYACFQDNNWEQTRMIAHKMKTSYNTIGATTVGELLANIEVDANESNKMTIIGLIDQVKNMSENIFIEVNNVLKN